VGIGVVSVKSGGKKNACLLWRVRSAPFGAVFGRAAGAGPGAMCQFWFNLPLILCFGTCDSGISISFPSLECM